MALRPLWKNSSHKWRGTDHAKQRAAGHAVAEEMAGPAKEESAVLIRYPVKVVELTAAATAPRRQKDPHPPNRPGKLKKFEDFLILLQQSRIRSCLINGTIFYDRGNRVLRFCNWLIV